MATATKTKIIVNSQPVIQTRSGKYVEPLNLKVSDIEIMDIADSLSKLARFNGHTSDFYSVAQHSVIVSHILDGTPHKFWGLLHDAAEAYLGDIPRLLKITPEFEFYREAEDRALQVIATTFGLDLNLEGAMPNAVKEADNIALATERRDLMFKDGIPWEATEGVEPLEGAITAWGPVRAKREFMVRYDDLMRGRV
jgi:uncharacterized protein